MKAQETILAGQILQCRDKLFARRHHVPSDMQSDWQSLMREASMLEPRIDPLSNKKSCEFTGNAKALKTLLGQLTTFARSLPH